MKFLCDQMLARLGRWLRAAGYDTVIINESLPDKDVFEKAQTEGRLVITRDRFFLELDKLKERVIWLRANTLEECVYELKAKIQINWMNAPFSRCLICNQILEKKEQLAETEIPSSLLTTQFYWCKNCKKVYWEGSHTKRMHQTLQRWQNEKHPID
jgi:uncharacterized protein